jgi:hypothetical protein
MGIFKAIFGKNVTPNFITQKTRGSRTDTFWGKRERGSSSHGHTVQKSGKTVYQRSMRGTVRKNNG